MNSTTRLWRLSLSTAAVALSVHLALPALAQKPSAKLRPAGSTAPLKKPVGAKSTTGAALGKAAPDSADTARGEAPVVEPTLTQDQALATAISLYKAHPDASSWQPVWKALHNLLANPQAAHASVGVLMHTNPGLTELSAKVDDAGGGARVWSFPKVDEAQAILVQWQQPVGPPTKTIVGHGRHKTVVFGPAPTVSRMQLIALPATVVFRDSQIVHSAGVPAAKGKPGKPEYRALVLSGNERGGSTIWLGAYKLAEGTWVESPSVLASVPPYLVQNIAGKASFSGNDLVFSLGSSTSTAGESPSSSQNSGYKIVLKFIDGKFLVSGKSADEGPSLVVTQWMQAVQHGQIDLARAWLSDPNLISIVKYAGLLNRPSDKPFKIMAMSAPFLNGERFRVITFDKTDLIVDVGKVKAQWAIKALFMAPPDPVAQKLLGTLPSAETVQAKTPANK